MRVIHGTVGHYDSVKEQIHCSRAVSMGSAATRKSPNAFMFCRQIDVLKRAGLDEDSFHVSCRHAVHVSIILQRQNK